MIPSRPVPRPRSPARRRWAASMVVGLLVLFVTVVPAAGVDTTYPSVHEVRLRGCDDARTCRFDLPGGPPAVTRNVPVRLAGLDVPDVHGACERERERARETRRVLLALLAAADTLTLKDPRRGEAFALQARVLADGRDAGEHLIREELARPGGDEPASWCPETSTRGSTVGANRPGIVIRKVDPGAERVLLENHGSAEVDMGGWALVHGPSGRRYVFPEDYRLAPGAGTIVTSGPGAVDAPPYFLRWTGNELWEDAGDTAFLLDDGEERVSRWPR